MRLSVPYMAVSNLESNQLVINQPARCSHCDAEPAPMAETHPVLIKADKIAHREIGRKYRIQKRILVRLPLCETCYRKEYLVAPDSYTKDDTPLGVQARVSEKLANTAGIVAGAGIILLTPFIPSTGFLGTLKPYWYILLGIGVLILGVTWGLQKISQSKVQRELNELHADPQQYRRADIWTNPIHDKPVPAAIAIEITMQNTGWLKDCARLNNWRIEE